MSWARPIWSLLAAAEGLLDRLLCVAGAVLFSQAPEFMQQYLQRLGGRLDEARRQLQQLRDIAEQSGLSLDQLASRTSAASDPAVARLGGLIHGVGQRVDDLAAAESSIRHASLWARPFVFTRHFDPEIGHATWAVFKPAVPTTVEGALYALVGMGVILAVYHGGIKGSGRAAHRAWRKRRARVRGQPTAAADFDRLR